MSAHVVALATPNPQEAESAAAYGAGVQPLLAEAGVKAVFRGPVAATIAGQNPPSVILVLEFPDGNAARAFFEQDAYKKLIPLRDKGFSRMEIFQIG